MERLADALTPALTILAGAIGGLALCGAAVWLILESACAAAPARDGQGESDRCRWPGADTLEPEGAVFLEGELWRARTSGGRVPAGTDVRVVSVEGATLVVEPAADAVRPPFDGGAAT